MQEVVLTVTDALVVLQIIERSSEQGIFKGSELIHVGQLYSSVEKQLAKIKQEMELVGSQSLPVIEEEKKE